MKKLIASILTVLTCGAAHALPMGNPSEVSLFAIGLLTGPSNCYDICDPCFNWCNAWSLRLGFYGDYVFNRHLKTDDSGFGLEDSEIHTNAEYVAINFCDRLDVFATFGTTNFSIKQNAVVFGSPIGFESDLYFKTHFSWSIGARALLWECGNFGLGIEGQYFRCNPDLDHFVNYNTGVKTYFNDVDGEYHEWQVGLGLSYRVATGCPDFSLVPYMGVKYSRAHFDIDTTFVTATTSTVVPSVTLTIDDLVSSNHWGYAVGMTFSFLEIAGVTVEGRFGDEKAVYVNGQVRF